MLEELLAVSIVFPVVESFDRVVLSEISVDVCSAETVSVKIAVLVDNEIKVTANIRYILFFINIKKTPFSFVELISLYHTLLSVCAVLFLKEN